MRKLIYLAVFALILVSCNNKTDNVEHVQPSDSICESTDLDKIGNPDVLALLNELKDAGCNQQKGVSSFYFSTLVESEVYMICPHNVQAPEKLMEVYNKSTDGKQKNKARNAFVKADSIQKAAKANFDKSYDIILKHLDKLNASAEASYRYEYHKGGRDTILAAVSFDTIPDEVDKAIRRANDGNYSSLHGFSSDLLTVRIQKGKNEDLISVKYTLRPQEDDRESIVPHDVDTSAIDGIIMNAISKYKAKNIDVSFRYDSTFCSDPQDVILVMGHKHFAQKEKNAKGKHYFIPLTMEERHELTSELQSRLADYCHTHRHSDFCLNQYYMYEDVIYSHPVFSITATYFDGGMEPISFENFVKSGTMQDYFKKNGPRMRTYYWTAELTPKGLHLMRLTAGPYVYIPVRWTEVKTCHNNKMESYDFEFEFPKLNSLDEVLLLIEGKVVTAKQMERFVAQEGTVAKVVNRENLLPFINEKLDLRKFTYDDDEYMSALEYKKKYGDKAMNGVIDVRNYSVIKGIKGKN